MSAERLLRVEAPHFVAGAVWLREGEVWRCVDAAPILRWMLGASAAYAREYIQLKGWSWIWLS